MSALRAWFPRADPTSETQLRRLRGFDLRYGAERPDGAERRDATELISDLPARGNPRGRLARDQCIPAWALLTGGFRRS